MIGELCEVLMTISFNKPLKRTITVVRAKMGEVLVIRLLIYRV